MANGEIRPVSNVLKTYSFLIEPEDWEAYNNTYRALVNTTPDSFPIEINLLMSRVFVEFDSSFSDYAMSDITTEKVSVSGSECAVLFETSIVPAGALSGKIHVFG